MQNKIRFNLKGQEATIENIHTKVSDQQIYEFYMTVPITTGKKYISPFRETDTANMTFFAISGGELLWRDWGDETQVKPLGPAAFVMKLYNCSYLEALQRINKDMGLGLDGVGIIPTTHKNKVDIPIKRDIIPDNKHKIIEVETQAFNAVDVKYWDQYGIDLQLLLKFNVFAAKYVWIDQVFVREYTKSNPVYAYYLDKQDGNEYYKIYCPFATKKAKWLSNAGQHIIQGLSQLAWTKGDDLIITKSLKDVMVLFNMGYDAIALQSETSSIPESLVPLLENCYRKIFVLFDNDDVGKTYSAKLCEEHDFISISIPEEHGAKDISDYVKKYGFMSGEVVMTELTWKGPNDLPF